MRLLRNSPLNRRPPRVYSFIKLAQFGQPQPVSIAPTPHSAAAAGQVWKRKLER